MSYNTADLWDDFAEQLTCLTISLNTYGKEQSFHGEVVTLKVFEDNSLVKQELQRNGTGKVLVVDGGGSKRCALVGDNLAQFAIDNGWSGLIVYGSIRDAQQINAMEVGIKALGTCPAKSIKRNEGQRNVEIILEGTKIKPGDYLYADLDGIVIAHHKLR